MRRARAGLVLLGALAVIGAGGGLVARLRHDHFDHWRHRRVFPTCEGCHAGATDSTRSIWPAASVCAACHNDTVKKKIVWSPPTRPPSNLRFRHAVHAEKAAGRLPRDSVVCTSCHLAQGAPWMQVQPHPQIPRCLACHGVKADHLSAANTTCGTCHLPLAQATALSKEQVARFPVPSYHRDSSFIQEHGKLAQPARGTPARVSVSCTICHARNFCITCHVNAPEVPAIQALAPDPRSLAIKAKLEAPAYHGTGNFLQQHGRMASRTPQRCAVCHTRESCLTCHVGQRPEAVLAMHQAGPGRSPGATVKRRKPASHGADFTNRHAPLATAVPKRCAVCHARADCLECHRPNAASAPGYHPAGFLARHPASAYAREASCAQCHNTRAFCADCHRQAGLVSRGALRGGYHDANPGFLLGHGPAARRSLESCVACHAQRDCLTCHSALGGRRFNPHGPGFDAERLRRRNPQMCSVCHGAAIPEP